MSSQVGGEKSKLYNKMQCGAVEYVFIQSTELVRTGLYVRTYLLKHGVRMWIRRYQINVWW